MSAHGETDPDVGRSFSAGAGMHARDTCAVLADGVHFCLTQRYGVFLDLNEDAYHAIPMAPPDDDADIPAWLADEFMRRQSELAAAGLLASTGKGPGGLDAYRRIDPPRRASRPGSDRRAFGVPPPDTEREAPASPIDMFDVAVACRRADQLLRRTHISRIVAAVRDRKKRQTMSAPEERLRDWTATFGQLRPWYPRDYRCLFDSLALIEFLARRGGYPDWLFGVQAQPFAAHCWVQVKGELLNESLEYASQFTPIMSV